MLPDLSGDARPIDADLTLVCELFFFCDFVIISISHIRRLSLINQELSSANIRENVAELLLLSGQHESIHEHSVEFEDKDLSHPYFFFLIPQISSCQSLWCERHSLLFIWQQRSEVGEMVAELDEE